jgi:crossover junction endodeoxyribonuclease RusA
MKLILDVPPSVNHMYRNAKVNGRTIKILTPNAKLWLKENDVKIQQFIKDSGWIKAEGKVIVYLWFFFKDSRKRDTHNCLKILMDLMEECGIYSNDMYALPRIIDFEIDRSFPRVEIKLEKVDGLC